MIGSIMDEHLASGKIPTIIAARPGVTRQALQTMLALVPEIEIVGIAGGGLSALNLARTFPPTLLIMDAGLPEDEIVALLRCAKQELCQARCLVLTETSRQQQVVLAAGADAVLLRGEPLERIREKLAEIGL